MLMVAGRVDDGMSGWWRPLNQRLILIEKDSSEVSGESQSTAASNSQPQNGDVSSVDANDGNQTPGDDTDSLTPYRAMHQLSNRMKRGRAHTEEIVAMNVSAFARAMIAGAGETTESKAIEDVAFLHTISPGVCTKQVSTFKTDNKLFVADTSTRSAQHNVHRFGFHPLLPYSD